MELQEILDYQKVDLQIYKLENELKNSPAAKAYAVANSSKKANTEDAQKCVRDAEEVTILIERYRHSYDKIASEIVGIADVLDTFEEPKEIDMFEKKIEQYKKELQSIEREITKLSNRLDTCSAKGKSCLNAVILCNKEIATSKVEIERLKKEMQGKVVELMKSLAALKPQLTHEFLKKYKEIRNNHKMPVLVQFNVSKKSCQGCGMDLHSSLVSDLGIGKLIDCPNCDRIIYKP